VIPLAETMRDVLAAYEHHFGAWIARTRPTSCAPGCAACCELLCLITWPEALLIAEVLRARGDVARLVPELQHQAVAASFDGIDAKTYFERRIGCAFLGPDRLCAVYAARPAPCRFHVAFTPAALCSDRTPGAATETIDNAPILRQVLGPVLEDLDRQGVPEAREAGPLPVMVLAALRALGEDVGPSISPREWLDRYGEHVWGYHRSETRTVRAIGERHG
jgi:Fe-S-cluster containining protein